MLKSTCACKFLINQCNLANHHERTIKCQFPVIQRCSCDVLLIVPNTQPHLPQWTLQGLSQHFRWNPRDSSRMSGTEPKAWHVFFKANPSIYHKNGPCFWAPSSFQSTEAYLLPFGLHTVFRWYLELTYEAWAQRNALSECKAIPRTTPRCRRVIRMESVERHVLTFRTLGHYRLHLRKEALSLQKPRSFRVAF